jgi:hypothetical protein
MPAQDAVDISGAVMLGPHNVQGNPQRAPITVTLTGARMDNTFLYLDYASKPAWAGRNYIFWRMPDRSIRGGHFEWGGTPGNYRRMLANIRNGYLRELPPAGAECWTLVIKEDMSERTNVVPCGAWKP